MVSIDSPPSADLILVIFGLQSAQFSKADDVSEVVHLPSTTLNDWLGFGLIV